MPNRSKISKQITRRTGGYNKTGKGTTVDQINRMRDEWEDDPDFEGTPGPYNIRKKVHKKKKKKNPFGLRVTPKKSKPAGSAMTTTDTRKKVIRPRTYRSEGVTPIVKAASTKVAPDLSHVEVPKTIPPRKRRTGVPPTAWGVGHGEDVTPVRTPRTVKSGPSRMPAFKATDIDAPTRIADEARQAKGDASLAERLAAKERIRKAIEDEEEEIKLTPKQRARLKALQRKRNVDSDATYTASKKGGQLKKKKTKAKSKSYKKAKKTYGGHHGGKLVASLYD